MADVKKIATRTGYGEALKELGALHDDIVVFDADLAGATQTGVFGKAFPDRHFNCGIAESNMIDMAVGIIIGGAFTAIVNSLVNDIFMPLLGLLTGGMNFAGLSLRLGGNDGDALQYGAFIAAVINFLLIALEASRCPHCTSVLEEG